MPKSVLSGLPGPDRPPRTHCDGHACRMTSEHPDWGLTHPLTQLRQAGDRLLCAGCYAAEGMQPAWAALPPVHIDDVPYQEYICY